MRKFKNKIGVLVGILTFAACKKEEVQTVNVMETQDPLVESLPSLDEEPKHKAMVLGTFHFDSNSDASDIKGKNRMDIFSEDNQKQLDSLMKILKKFNPTKIAVEWQPRVQPTVDSLYNAYKNDSWEIRKNEIFQIGFRLAKQLNHDKLYCVDNRPPMPEAISEMDDDEDLENFADSLGQKELMHAYDDDNKAFNDYLDSIQKTNTVLDVLGLYNSEQYAKRSKQIWLTGMVNLGVYDNYMGTDLTGHWYRRNTRIFVNTANLVENEEERILIIYGAMHKWLLDELFEGSPEFESVQFNDL
ncbi:DUF5694 domain-containing protein [Croceitalea marina]|uniref:DUF5694 domain-containing protein n=1 Tax=Croceitalea marina TaxID=1775166 RepID=A0ABW5MXA9_9FLAO